MSQENTMQAFAPGDIFAGATLLNLTSTTCRWPQGHPGEPGFAFCGARTAAGQPYCAYHASVAYQSPNKDRRQRA